MNKDWEQLELALEHTQEEECDELSGKPYTPDESSEAVEERYRELDK